MSKSRLFLPDGTELRKCPLKKRLYCSRDGRFFSWRNAQLYPLKPSIAANYNRKTCHTSYPIVTRTAPRNCHVIMALTWLGSRPIFKVEHPSGLITFIKAEIDHLNGNILDWRADNLQWVTPEENRRRARILRSLRASGLDPCTLTRDQLLDLFNQALLRCATTNNLAGDVYEGE